MSRIRRMAMVLVVGLVASSVRAQLLGMGGPERELLREGGVFSRLVEEVREAVAAGELLTELPVPEGDPSEFRWERAERMAALAVLDPGARPRRHRPRPVVPESLALPWSAGEGEAAPEDPEIPMPRGMTYVNWELGLAGMADLSADVTFHRRPRAAEGEGFYLQVYDGNIGDTGQYFGFQYFEQDGQTRTQFIWSQFGTRDLDRLDEEPEGYHESAGYEGDFISLRYPYEFGRGTYTVHVHLDEVGRGGAWYLMRIYDHQAATWTRIGRMQFPFDGGGLPLIRDGGGSWHEVFSGVERPSELTPFHLSLGGVYTLGRSAAPRAASTRYAEDIHNSDISWDPEGRRFHVRYGGSVRRRSAPGRRVFGGLAAARDAARRLATTDS